MNFTQKFVRYLGEINDEQGWCYDESERLLVVLGELASKEKITLQDIEASVKKHFNDIPEEDMDEYLEETDAEARLTSK